MSLPQKTITNVQLNKRWLNDVPDYAIDDLDSWVDGRPVRPVVNKEVLEKACRKYFKIASSKQNIRLLARANKAASEFANTSFSDCVLACWLQVETYLYAKLENFMLSQGSAKYNKKRREKLLKSTSSQMIELLEISGQLSQKKYDLLSKVRKIRNEVVHNGYSASHMEASSALSLLELVIKENSGENIVLVSGLSIRIF
jgi:hypothetical protein